MKITMRLDLLRMVCDVKDSRLGADLELLGENNDAWNPWISIRGDSRLARS